MTNYDGGYVMDYQGKLTAADYASYTAATGLGEQRHLPRHGWGQPNNLGLVRAGRQQAVGEFGWEAAVRFHRNQQPEALVGSQRSGRDARAVPGRSVGRRHPRHHRHHLLHAADRPVRSQKQRRPLPSPPTWPRRTRCSSSSVPLCSHAEHGGQRHRRLAARIHHRVYGGKTYVFVLNLSGKAVSEKRHDQRRRAEPTATVANQNRSVQLQGGTFTDSFAADGVNIYEIG